MIRAAFYEKFFLNFKLMEWSAVHKKLLHEVIHISTNSITIIATLFTLIGKKKKKFLQASGMFILLCIPKITEQWMSLSHTCDVGVITLICFTCTYLPVDWCLFLYRPTSEKPKKGGLFKRNTGKDAKEQSDEKHDKSKGLVLYIVHCVL